MTRTFLFFSLVLSQLVSCKEEKQIYMFTSFREPAKDGLCFLYSADGYHWDDLGCSFLKPEAGQGKLMRDPSIVQGPDGTFHMVWTTAWRGDPGFGYASSPDLVQWSDQRFIPVMEHEPETVNVWAPEIFYDDEKEVFVIIWASTIPHRFAKGVEDENNNHRMYHTLTKDFKKFSPASLFFNPGFSVIDAVIVKQASDSYVLVLKDNTRPNRNIKVASGDNALGPYSNVSKPFSGNFTEGPTVTQVNGEYVIYFDAYRDKKYGAVTTRDFKTFSDISDRVHFPPGHKHGTVFKVSKSVFDKVKAESKKK